MFAFATGEKRFRWTDFCLVSMLTPSRSLLATLLFLWPSFGMASGWNDFSREIGYGFRISKTDSFHVCLNLLTYSNIVCGDTGTGDYGPITGYAFTNKHLLVRTTGTKPAPNSGTRFTADWDRELFFIVEKRINNPLFHLPIGPMERDAFLANPAVPAKIRWLRPTRFAEDSDRDGDTPLLLSIIITIIAWLWVFGPILIWPILFLFIAWRIYRWMQPGRPK